MSEQYAPKDIDAVQIIRKYERLARRDEQPEYSDVLRQEALLHLFDVWRSVHLFERAPVGIDFDTDFLPRPFDPQEATYQEWLEQIRLGPLRLLYRDIPELEYITPDYLTLVATLGMINANKHDPCCDAHEIGSKLECEFTVNCPALVTRSILLRTSGLLVQSIYSLDKASETYAFERECIEEKIEAIRAAFDRMGIMDRSTYQDLLSVFYEGVPELYERMGVVDEQ